MAADHPLAGIWNDPEFVRRLVGGYGFLSEAEPRMTAEEQALYRDKIVPLLREDPARAATELEAAVQPSGSAVFDYTLGTVLFQSGDLTNAVRRFESALAKFPDYRRAARNLGLALVRDGRYAEAVGPLTRTLALGGGDGKIFGLLGFAHLSQNRPVSAEGAYRQALVFEPDNLDFQLGLVKAYIGVNNLDAAMSLLDELIRQHPERESLWSLQANVFIQKEQPGKAVVNLEVLRRTGKASAAQLALLGDLHLSREHPDLALGAYLESLEKDGGKQPARGLRPAEILVARGAVAEAGQLLARVRSAGGLSAEDEMRLLKLEARVALAAGRAEEGIRSLEEILRRNPLDGEALLLSGDHYGRSGDAEKAAFRFESAARLPGFEPDALLKHAQLKVRQQKYAEAVELLRRAQKMKPRDNVARYLEKVEQVAARARS
jgi:tetratricopeptide (TPR) repeat protein